MIASSPLRGRQLDVTTSDQRPVKRCICQDTVMDAQHAFHMRVLTSARHSPLVKTAHGKGARERAVRTVSGSPCSACRMKLLTTRPSFMCILEPKVLKILATLTSTPSCERGKDVSRGLFGSLFFFSFFSSCPSI